eukprot:1143192-Pelagomonas_calceolata.AAC.4
MTDGTHCSGCAIRCEVSTALHWGANTVHGGVLLSNQSALAVCQRGQTLHLQFKSVGLLGGRKNEHTGHTCSVTGPAGSSSKTQPRSISPAPN